jgi:chorismate dehydratase
MGLLSEKGEIAAGLFSCMDYLRQRERLELVGGCIATRDQVKSVMLFSKEGWADLQGKTIGITDDTATSVHLLKVLLAHKHGVNARFVRLHAGVNDLSGYDAILLIGDEALRRRKWGLPGFDLAYDLATEWYEWKKLPFVFAVWATKSSLDAVAREQLRDTVEASLRAGEADLSRIGEWYGKGLGLTAEETAEYLEGFIYRLGDREREAMQVFESLLAGIQEPATEQD